MHGLCGCQPVQILSSACHCCREVGRSVTHGGVELIEVGLPGINIRAGTAINLRRQVLNDPPCDWARRLGTDLW